MNSLKKKAISIGLAVAMGAGGLAMTATTVSAEVVCNAAGECWRVNRHYEYDPGFGLTVYGDDWYRAHRYDRHYHWRTYRGGRGYWRDGVWIRF